MKILVDTPLGKIQLVKKSAKKEGGAWSMEDFNKLFPDYAQLMHNVMREMMEAEIGSAICNELQIQAFAARGFRSHFTQPDQKNGPFPGSNVSILGAQCREAWLDARADAAAVCEDYHLKVAAC